MSILEQQRVCAQLSRLPLTGLLVVGSLLLRIGFFLFGLYQDATMEVKYTDIDYMVFTDAAKYIFQYNQSPYARETYRYTPILAYLLVPTAIKLPDYPILDVVFFSFGKFIFIISDLITGVLILKVLNHLDGLKSVVSYKNLALSAIWLLNPMVITISTRGSSESFLTVLLMLFVYFLVVKRNMVLSGIFFGFAIHFKIYPVIYFPSVLLYLAYRDFNMNNEKLTFSLIVQPLLKSFKLLFFFTLSTTIAFTALSYGMYLVFGYEFLFNSYLYHFIRTDHRHNFSIYNMSLYFTSSLSSNSSSPIFANQDWLRKIAASLDFTKFAFVPQFLVSAVLIPALFNFNPNLSLSKNTGYTKDTVLLTTLFIQTFAFVNYNKVITSQYFIWYLLFLPFYLKHSSFLNTNKTRGIACLIVWVLGQAFWLFNGYKLEFLGQSVFYPWLFASSLVFFLGNTWITGTFIDDALSAFSK